MCIKIYHPYLVPLRDFCQTQCWHTYSVGTFLASSTEAIDLIHINFSPVNGDVFQVRKLKGNWRDRASVDIAKSRNIDKGFIIEATFHIK